MVPQSFDETEVTVRKEIASELHDVFHRLRTIGGTAKEISSSSNDADRRAWLLALEKDLTDCIRQIKRVVVPFLLDEKQIVESDTLLRFLEDLKALSSTYRSPSREITLKCDPEVIRGFTGNEFWSMRTIIANCLGNAAQHAKASWVKLILQEDPLQPNAWVQLQIEYDGAGDPRLNDLDTLAKETYPEHEGIHRICRARDSLSARSQVHSQGNCTSFTFTIPAPR